MVKVEAYEVVVPLEEYNELVEKAAQIDAVERIMNTGRFFSAEDIAAILGINIKKEKEK